MVVDGEVVHLLVDRFPAFGLVGFKADGGERVWDVTHSRFGISYGMFSFFNPMQVDQNRTIHVAARTTHLGGGDSARSVAFRY
jgi:hypothetical protein